MTIYNKFLILIVSFILISCSTIKTTTIRKSSDCDEKLIKTAKIAVLPVKAEIHTLEAFGKKVQMFEYEEIVESFSAEILAANLSDKGFIPILITPKELHDKKISQSVVLLTENYNNIVNDLYYRLLWEIETAHNINILLDRQLLNFNEKIDSDFVIFMDYHAVHSSFGKNMLNFTAAVLTKTNVEPDTVIIRIGVVDLKTGKLIWSNMQNVNAAGTPWGLGKFNSSVETERKRLDYFIKIILSSFPSK